MFSVAAGREVESYQCRSTRFRLPSACCPVTASACQHINTRYLHLWHWDTRMLQYCWYYSTDLVCGSPPYLICIPVYCTVYLCLLGTICFRCETSFGNVVFYVNLVKYEQHAFFDSPHNSLSWIEERCSRINIFSISPSRPLFILHK